MQYLLLTKVLRDVYQTESEHCKSGRDSPHQYDTGWIKLLVASVSLSSARKFAQMTTILFIYFFYQTIHCCTVNTYCSHSKIEKPEAKMESDRSVSAALKTD